MSGRKRVARWRPEGKRQPIPFFVCSFCGKRGYTTRRAARDAMKTLDDPAAYNVYECQAKPAYADDASVHHVGHVVPARFRVNGSTE